MLTPLIEVKHDGYMHDPEALVITEEGREILARAMFDRQAETYEFAEGMADLAWEDREIRAFWRAEADHVAEVLGIG